MAARTASTPVVATVEKAEPVEKPTGFVVSAAMVTAWDERGRDFTLLRGDVVTDRVAPACLEHLQSLRFVESV